MENIWVSSDLHFYHNQSFIWEARGYGSVDEMNEKIIENWNSVVHDNDIVYLLGDIMLSDRDKGIECLSRLNGNIYIALGNHDNDTKVALYRACNNVKNIELAYRLKVGKRYFLFTHYPTIVANYNEDLYTKTVNCCGHVHTPDKFKDFQYGCYHVELDAHNNYPVNLDTIVSDIITRKEKMKNV